MANIKEFKEEILLPAETRMKEFGLPIEQIKKECSFAVQVVNKNRLLKECTPNSLLTAVVNIAQVSLTLNPISKEAYLIPRWNGKIKAFEANLEPSYIGLVKLITDAGSVTSIQTNLVYDNEDFTVEHGLNGTNFRHVPILKGDRGAITGVYSVAVHSTGERTFEYMPREEVEKIRNYSDSWLAYMDPGKDKVTTCIWKDSEGEMFRKTCLKRLQKYLPRTKKMQYVDKAVQLSNSDWEASAQQVDYAESLIRSSALLDSQKDDLYRQLQTARSYDIELMIEYLKDCQSDPIESGNNYNQEDINKKLDKVMTNESK